MADFKALKAGRIEANKKKMGHKCCAAAKCSNRTDLKKQWELRMRRKDDAFKSVGNKVCCSEHFLSPDFKQSLTGHTRELKKGSCPSVFEWAPEKVTDVRGERSKTRQEKKSRQAVEQPLPPNSGTGKPASKQESDEKQVYFGPHTVEELAREKSETADRLEEELARAKQREYIFKFGLERFSSSPTDINFYTGFPDYETLMEFWKYVHPNASRLTYYSYVRDTTQVNMDDVFPYLNGTERKFPSSSVGAKRTLQPIDELWLFLTRIRLGLFERDLALRFNISVSTVSDIIITWSNYLYMVLRGLPVWASREDIKQNLPEAVRGRFENTRCIIDFTEMKCEKPQDLDKQSEFYSEYKTQHFQRTSGDIP